MFLYEVAGNELLCILNKSCYGANIGRNKIACPSFADDVTLISVSKEGIQQLVNTAYQCSKRWRFSYNPSKCKLIVFGNKQDKNINVMLGNHNIDQVDADVHLGTNLSSKDKCQDEYINERIEACKSIYYASQSLGSYRVPVTPVTSSKLYWQVCIPKLCYGVEVMELSDQNIDALEKFHSTTSKQIQGLPQQCSNSGSIGTIGWKKIETHISIMKLLFLWRLLILPMICIYKDVIIKRFERLSLSNAKHKGPVWDYVQLCQRYDLIDIVVESIQNGLYMSMSEWKTLVKRRLNQLDSKSWKIACSTYKNLKMLNLNVENIQMLSWWKHCYYDPYFSKYNRTIVKLLLNTSRRGKYKCVLCNNGLNSADHILFVCPNLHVIRSVMWDRVINVCPNQLVLELLNMNTVKRCTFILNGLNVPYTNEWKGMYDNIALYVHELVLSYDTSCNSIQPLMY